MTDDTADETAPHDESVPALDETIAALERLAVADYVPPGSRHWMAVAAVQLRRLETALAQAFEGGMGPEKVAALHEAGVLPTLTSALWELHLASKAYDREHAESTS